MSISINNSGNDYSSFFGAVSQNSSNSSSDSIFSSSMLSDYASIKNGSYAKLTKAYYGSSNTKKSEQTNSETNSSLKKEYSVSLTDAEKLKASASKLADSKTLFDKISVKDENGEEKMDYDYDKITGAIKSFISDYNDMVKNGSESTNTSVLRNTLSMVSRTAVNEDLLKSVGITIKSDNSLSFDEEAVKTARMSDIKSLFNGKNSLADSISSNASGIYNAVSDKLNQLGSYTINGTFSNAEAAGNIYDGSY